MKAEIYERYARLAEAKKKAEDELEECRKEVMADLQANSLDQYKTEGGTFSIMPRKVWVYSEKVDTLKASLDALKEYEENNNIALVEEVPTLRFQLARK